jgi:EamA-like transporter family.
MNKLSYFMIFLVSVFISSISQVILKKSANKPSSSKLAEYLNPSVMLAYFLFFGSTLLTTFAYKGVPLSVGPILESTGYIYVAILSVIFLNEKLKLTKLIGYFLIIIGVVIATII